MIKKLMKSTLKKSLLLAFKMYLLPSIMALHAKNINVDRIALINFLTGWTIIGWVILCIYVIDHTEIYD